MGLFCLCYNAFVLPRRDVVERALEMSFRVFERRALLIRLQVRVDQLNQSV